MLHDGADDSNRFLECSAERGFLPAPGVPLHTEAVGVGAQACKSNTIIVLSGLFKADWLRSTGNQIITARANVHAGGELVGLGKLDELGLSGTHRVIHGLSLPGASPGRSSGRGEPCGRSSAR